MLHFNGIEPVDFRGHECQPNLDAEKRLRLSTIKFDTEEDVKRADEVLASCFDDPYAGEFIKTHLTSDDKVVLKTYLLGGETGLNRLSEATSGAIEKYVQRAIEENQ